MANSSSIIQGQNWRYKFVGTQISHDETPAPNPTIALICTSPHGIA